MCNLSFGRMDNLKAHTKIHNKEESREENTQLITEESTTDAEKMHNILQLQPYELSTHTEQEIQLVVSSEVDRLNLMQVQKPGINLLTTEGNPEELASQRHTHSGLTLFTQPSSQVQNLALVTQDGLESSSHIQTMTVSSERPEQMHVITLTKEAMEQLQVQHGSPQKEQMSFRPFQQLQVIQQSTPQLSATHEASKKHNRSHSGAIHIGNQAGQPISISQTSEQIPSTQIQGQTFQIQAGTVSYLYTNNVAPQS